MDTKMDRRVLGGLLVTAAATVLGLIDSSQVQYDRAVQGAPISWGHALIHGLPRWYAWALLLPGVLLATRKLESASVPWRLKLVAHAATGVGFTALQVFLFSSVSTALHGQPDLVAHLRPAFLKYVGLTFLGGLVTYAVIVAAWYGWRIYRRDKLRERETARLELRTAELKALLAEAHLGQLQSQLQPHFLFNALHTLGAMIESGEREGAGRMTQRLSEFLRTSLDLAGCPEIPLATELELAQAYLDVQRIRFGDRLSYSHEIPAALRDALVPTLVLQPLVENAIVHGLERKVESGTVRLSARAEHGRLVITVSDDGPGPDAGRGAATDPSSGGVGLANCRARLAELYGGDASLTLRRTEAGETEARVEVPLRTAEVAIGRRAGPVQAVGNA